jgi:hypothetical protein
MMMLEPWAVSMPYHDTHMKFNQASSNCINLEHFMFTLITILVNGNFNNGVVVRPNCHCFYFMRISGCLYQNINNTLKSQKQLLNEKECKYLI